MRATGTSEIHFKVGYTVWNDSKLPMQASESPKRGWTTTALSCQWRNFRDCSLRKVWTTKNYMSATTRDDGIPLIKSTSVTTLNYNMTEQMIAKFRLCVQWCVCNDVKLRQYWAHDGESPSLCTLVSLQWPWPRTRNKFDVDIPQFKIKSSPQRR